MNRTAWFRPYIAEKILVLTLGLVLAWAGPVRAETEEPEPNLEEGIAKIVAEMEGMTEEGRLVSLFSWCFDGPPEILAGLVAAGVEVDVLDFDSEFGESLLSVAIRSEWGEKKAAVLLKAGADPNFADPLWGTPLNCAVANGSEESVKLLLAAGADPNAKNSRGNRPLHLAAADSRLEVVKLLLAAGADPNVKNDRGDRPLHAAAAQSRPELLAVLLEAGAEVNVVNDKGHIPLWYASCEPSAPRPDRRAETIRLLLDHGAEVSLHRGEISCLHVAAVRGRAETIRLLIEAGDRLDFVYESTGSTSLMVLARLSDDPEAVSVMLAAGADPARTDHQGWDSLEYARRNETPAAGEIVRLLEEARK